MTKYGTPSTSSNKVKLQYHTNDISIIYFINCMKSQQQKIQEKCLNLKIKSSNNMLIKKKCKSFPFSNQYESKFNLPPHIYKFEGGKVGGEQPA